MLRLNPKVYLGVGGRTQERGQHGNAWEWSWARDDERGDGHGVARSVVTILRIEMVLARRVLK